MKWITLVLPVVVLAGLAAPAQAQLFNRKVRLTGMQVPELIMTARGDTDERRRIAAIEQLRESDAKAFPDIVPNLVEVMLHDTKYNVRMEAMHSLVKIRPMTPMVGQALQQTAQYDESWRVRTQTKTQIWLNGYNGNNQNGAQNGPTTREPPLGNSPMPGQPTYVPGNVPGQMIYVPGNVSGGQQVYVPAGSSQSLYTPGTAPGQPIYMPSSGVPSSSTPGNLGRPLPSARPAAPYSTALPQTPAPQVPAPLPQIPATPPQIPVTPQIQAPLPQIPAPPQTQAPLPQIPAPPRQTSTQPLPPAPVPQSSAPLPLPPAPTPSTPNVPVIILTPPT